MPVIVRSNVDYALDITRQRDKKPYGYGGTWVRNDTNRTTDCIAEGTLVTTARGDVPIEQLTERDRVLTRQGYRRVLNAWKVRDDAPTVVLNGVCMTPDHRVWTENRGWIPAASVEATDTLVSCHDLKRSSSRDTHTAATQTLTGPHSAPTSSAKVQQETQSRRFTARSGSTTTDPSPSGARSTMSTMTLSTTTRPILSASKRPSIAGKARPRGGCMPTHVRSVGLSSRYTRPPADHVGSAVLSTRRPTTIESGMNATVYDVSVEGVHEFFAGGILVHNCSGIVTFNIDAVLNGAGMSWSRHGISTEAYRYVGGPGSTGPFGTIRVGRWQDIPANAVVKIGLQHGPGGGANSHMACTIRDNAGNHHNIESRGGTFASGGGQIIDRNARGYNDSLFHDWFYLPGDLGGPDTGPASPQAPGSVYLGRDCGRYECRGDRVLAMQIALNRDYPLYSRLEVDGDFGPATESVVREFQHRSQMTVDGIAGPAVLSALGLNFQESGAPVATTDDRVGILMKALAPTGITRDRMAALAPAVCRTLIACGATTVSRIAMWCAQIGHESAGLRYMEEIASGADYEGRLDLGNTQPGDGRRFKGRGPIQVTGRSNYTKLSEWAWSRGIVPTRSFFVDNPAELASDQYGFVGVIWYWTEARSGINAMCDARDIVGVTKAINGGTNGLEDSPDGTPGRRTRHQRALAMGDTLLALVGTTDPVEEIMTDTTKYQSQSPYRDNNDKIMTVRDAVFAIDAMMHGGVLVEPGALRGEPWAIEKLIRLAAGQGAGAYLWYDKTRPDTWAINHAKYILTLIEATNKAAIQDFIDGNQ